MPPKKAKSVVPAGPTPQEVEATFKEMDVVLETELALLKDTLVRLQSETAYNEQLVERYGELADKNQSAIEALEKHSNEELLHLARLFAQSEAQRVGHDNAVRAAEAKVDAIYDAMDFMKKEDAAMLEKEREEEKATTTRRRTTRGTAIAADAVDAAQTIVAAEEAGVVTAADAAADTAEAESLPQQRQQEDEEEFPPPLGTVCHSTSSPRKGGEENSEADKTAASATATALLSTTTLAQHQHRPETFMAPAELAALFYARTRQLELLKKKLAALEVEEGSVMHLLEDDDDDNEDDDEGIINGNDHKGSDVRRNMTNATISTNRTLMGGQATLLAPLSTTFNGGGGASPSVTQTTMLSAQMKKNKISDPRNLFLPRPDRIARKKDFAADDDASDDDDDDGNSSSMYRLDEDSDDDFGANPYSDGEDEGQDGGEEEGNDGFSFKGGKKASDYIVAIGDDHFYKGEPRPELVGSRRIHVIGNKSSTLVSVADKNKQNRGSGNNSVNNNNSRRLHAAIASSSLQNTPPSQTAFSSAPTSTSTGRLPWTLGAIARQSRKQRVHANYCRLLLLEKEKERAVNAADAVSLRPISSVSSSSSFPIVFMCAPTVVPFSAVPFLIDQQQSTNSNNATNNNSSSSPLFALDMSFQIASDALTTHYCAAVRHLVMVPQSLLSMSSAAGRAAVDSSSVSALYFEEDGEEESPHKGGEANATLSRRVNKKALRFAAKMIEQSARGDGGGGPAAGITSVCFEPTTSHALVEELLGVRDGILRQIEKKKQQQQMRAGASSDDGDAADASSPSVIILLRGRVVPDDNSGGDDDIYLSFGDIDDGPTAVPPIAAPPTNPQSVTATTASSGGVSSSSTSTTPFTVSVKAIISTIVGEVAAALLSTASSTASLVGSAAAAVPQLLLIIEANGCTAGAGVPLVSSSSASDVDNDGFVLAVGPTTNPLFCYKRKQRSDASSSSSSSTAASPSFSVAAAAMAKATTASTTKPLSASAFADRLFDELLASDSSSLSLSSLLFPRTYCPPSWVNYSVPEELSEKRDGLGDGGSVDGHDDGNAKPRSSFLLTSPNPPLPQDPINGSGIVSHDGAVMVSCLVPRDALIFASASNTNAETKNNKDDATEGNGGGDDAGDEDPRQCAITTSKAASTSAAAEAIIKNILSRSSLSSSSTEVLAVDKLTALFRSFKHEHSLHAAVDMMSAEVKRAMAGATYDAVYRQHQQQQQHQTFSEGNFPNNTTTDTTHTNNLTVGGSMTMMMNDNVTLSDVSVVYNPDQRPISPFYNNATAKASRASSKFAAAVRSRVGFSGVGGGEEGLQAEGREGSPYRSVGGGGSTTDNASATALNTTNAASNRSSVGRRVGGDGTILISNNNDEREPIFLLLQQTTPIEEEGEEDGEHTNNSSASKDPSLTYGPLLRELQQELTYRRLETREVPLSLCYRVDVWHAGREEVMINGDADEEINKEGEKIEGGKESGQKRARRVSVVVALWPVAHDPMERWWLKARHEAKAAADKQRLLSRVGGGIGGSHSSSLPYRGAMRGNGIDTLSPIDGSVHPNRTAYTLGAVDSASALYTYDQKKASLRATAVTVGDAATATLTVAPTNTSASSPTKGSPAPSSSSPSRLQQAPSSLTHAEAEAIVFKVCETFIRNAGAFAAVKTTAASSAEKTEGEDKTTANAIDATKTDEGTEAEEKGTKEKLEGCANTQSDASASANQGFSSQTEAPASRFNGQWSMTPLTAISALVHFNQDLLEGISRLNMPPPASATMEKGTAEQSQSKNSGASTPSTYCLTVSPLPAVSVGAPTTQFGFVSGRRRGGASYSYSALPSAASLQRLSNLTVQRRYGLALTNEEEGAITAAVAQQAFDRTRPFTPLVYSPLRSRGPIVALFIINDSSELSSSTSTTMGSSLSSSYYAMLQQAMALRVALCRLSSSSSSSCSSSGFSLSVPTLVSLFSNAVLPLMLLTSELTSTSSSTSTSDRKDQNDKQQDEKEKTKKKTSSSPLAILSSLAPPSLLDFLSTQPRGVPYGCLALFQAHNRSVPHQTQPSSSSSPPPPPKPWIVPAQQRVVRMAAGPPLLAGPPRDEKPKEGAPTSSPSPATPTASSSPSPSSTRIVSADHIARAIGEYIALSVMMSGHNKSNDEDEDVNAAEEVNKESSNGATVMHNFVRRGAAKKGRGQRIGFGL